VFVGALALVYAFFAGLRTVGDPDLGWQLATGRWILQHHAVPYTDILSYTSRGHAWSYPALSQAIFYCAYQLGGYSLLSWLHAAACVTAIALILTRNAVTNALALIAVPLIAARTEPRAELFTMVLFAAFLNIFWRYQNSGRGPLWLLPLLMCLWVNLHLGFIAGLGLCGAYVFLELSDAVAGFDASAAWQRLRSALPWLAAIGLAPLLNPWGLKVYWADPIRGSYQTHGTWITELKAMPLTFERACEGLAWRSPDSALWWLLAVAVLAVFAAVFLKRFAAAILIGAASYLALHVLRYQALFACVVVVIGGSVLAEFAGATLRGSSGGRIRTTTALAVLSVLAAFAGLRVWDLIDNRYYLATVGQTSVFGAGESFWFPEDAATFIKREHLPPNLFNEYNLGGFVSWRLSPEYPDYIDGRGVSPQLYFHSVALLRESPDSADWRQEADAQHINFVLLSLDHEYGLGTNLGDFCRSQDWRTVYLDTRAAVFVRVRPENGSLLSRLGTVDCYGLRFDAPPAGSGIRTQLDRFNYHLNAAFIFNSLGRSGDALRQLEWAERIRPESPFLHYAKGIALQDRGDMAGAEHEFRSCLELDHLDAASLALGGLYRSQRRFGEAIVTLNRGAQWSLRPHRLYLELGATQIANGLPEAALQSFDRADKESPYGGDSAALGISFNALMAEGRARAWLRLGDLTKATDLLEESARLEPGDSGRWLMLANLYDARGMRVEASAARKRAEALGKPDPSN
jgi:tetratricopeptide (TPR) repeat protein